MLRPSLFLVLAFGATEMKYVHLHIEPISDCRFKNGMCEENAAIQLDEQRGLRSLTSASSSNL
jgi:hypothetical protein